MLDDRIPDTVRVGSRARIRREPPRPCILADEVAVDFPSMRPIVERMRTAFLAGEDEAGVRHTRLTRFELTQQQALEGVSVPLELTVRHVCPACGGRGELQTGACGLCHGVGTGLLEHRFHVPVPPGVRDGACLRYAVAPLGAVETHVEVRIAVQ